MAFGIKILRELPEEDPSSVNQDETIDIVAIHGIGAHPDDTWTWKKLGEEACWLIHPEMLPKAIPNARIMRFGYKSVWFGREQDEPKKTKVSDVARMLLDALELNRRNITRPIIFIAHSYGGLVLIDALRRSFDHPDEWLNPFGHTAGLVFFGTPFRGRGGLSLNELVQRAAQGNPDSIMYPETMSLAAAENPYLEDIVSRFTETRRGDNPIPVCSFYETLASPVGKTLSNKDVEDYYIVPEGSACLDGSKGVERHPLERHHYNLQKFPFSKTAKDGVGRDTQYSIVEKVIINMVKGAKKYLEKCPTSNQHLNDVTRWLAAPDLSNNFNKAKMNRHPGSGQWFLQGETYSAWKTQRNSFLWLHGILGCGKTILASTIIEDLKEQKTRFPTLLFFYFDFSDTSKQSFENALRSLISQLYCKSKCLQELVDSLYSSCEHGRQQPSAESLHTTLLGMVKKAGEVWIVLDALDECQTRDEYRPWGLFPCIQDLRDSQMNCHILVTSRPEQDIESAIRDHAGEKDIVSILSDVIEGDIRSYIHGRVRKHKGLRRWQSRPSIQTEIEATLLEKANGMFRWVSCQLDALEKCLDQRTLRRALKSLPKDLDETYARILTNLLDNHKDYTVRLLQFLTYSKRPLRIDEAVDAIAVDLNERPRFDPENRLPDPDEVFRYCSSLAVRVERKDEHTEKIITEIQLAHVSVKDYLTSNRIEERIARDLEETVAHGTIAKICLAYLIELDQNLGVKDIEQSFFLVEYAYSYWLNYAAEAERKGQMDFGILFEFVESEAYPVYSKTYATSPRTPLPLYFLSYFGLSRGVKFLLDKGADVNAHNGDHNSALQAASQGGHKEVVQLLLQRGADINVHNRRYGNALWQASSGGNKEVVQLLLERCANVNIRSAIYGDLLKAASKGGRKEVVHLLLERSAYSPKRLSNALQAASKEGREEVVQLLLERGANNAKGSRNALQEASKRGHKGVVRLLLNGGVEDWNAQTRRYGNALQIAVLRGHKEIVQLLLDRGADANAYFEGFGNALQTALWRGRKEVARLLLDRGADVNLLGGTKFGSPLQLAAMQGYKEIVQTMLGKGADVNAGVDLCNSALWYALRRGDRELVQILRNAGAVDTINKKRSWSNYTIDGQPLDGLPYRVQRRA